MNFLEKDLEDILFESYHSASETNKLNSKGLEVMYSKPYIIKRQLKVGNYGVLDLITLEMPRVCDGDIIEDGVITIFELKKDTINNDALIQALRYTKGVINYLAKSSKLQGFSIKIVLIGRCVNLGDWIYNSLLWASSKISIEIYEYGYDIDGISFNQVDLMKYSLVKEGFNGL